MLQTSTYLRVTEVADDTRTQHANMLLNAWSHSTGELLAERQSDTSLPNKQTTSAIIRHK